MACIETTLHTVHCIFLCSICHIICSDKISARCERSVRCYELKCHVYQTFVLHFSHWLFHVTGIESIFTGDMSGNSINSVRGELLYVLTLAVNLLACLLAYLLTSLNSPPWEASSTELIKFPTFCVTWRFIIMFTGSITCPHPEPDKSTPCRLTLFLQDLFEYYDPICA